MTRAGGCVLFTLTAIPSPFAMSPVTCKVYSLRPSRVILTERRLGYHVRPRDGSHFVKLFADAQFYSCMFNTSALIKANGNSAPTH